MTAADDGLYLRWGNSSDLLYIGSTGPSRAYNRPDSIAMELSDDGNTITMRWSNGDVAEFARLP